jgi:hypothetical protein
MIGIFGTNESRRGRIFWPRPARSATLPAGQSLTLAHVALGHRKAPNSVCSRIAPKTAHPAASHHRAIRCKIEPISLTTGICGKPKHIAVDRRDETLHRAAVAEDAFVRPDDVASFCRTWLLDLAIHRHSG